MGITRDMDLRVGDYSINCFQPLSLSLSSALIQTPAIISWNARTAQAATKPTMARPVTTLLLADSSSEMKAVAADPSVEAALAVATAPKAWVGGWRLTVALGSVAVPAGAAGMPGLDEIDEVAGVKGLDEVASLMVGAGVAGAPGSGAEEVFSAMVGAGVAGALGSGAEEVFSAMVGAGVADAGLLGTGTGGLGPTVALGGSGSFSAEGGVAIAGFGAS